MTRRLQHSSPPRPPGQRGAALLTAMIIVTLVATLTASMVWQQWRAVQVEGAERARVQAGWILDGALDWARLILKEDARTTPAADHLGEVWATPLAEARLSTFLAADKDNTDDGPEAFLSGVITDAQGRYNLGNLVGPKGVDPLALAGLETLCDAVGVSKNVAAQVAGGLRLALSGLNPAAPNLNSPMLPHTVSELVWLGVDAEAVRLLAPYVVLLPAGTAVNLNTAPPQVLMGALGVDAATAERLAQERGRAYFKNVPDALSKVSPNFNPPNLGLLAVSSSYFEVRGRLRLGDRALEQVSLVQRLGGPGNQVVVLRQDRVTTREAAGS